MNLLITGADRPLGHLAALHFGDENDLRLTGYSPSLQGDSGREYCTADLRVSEEVEPLLSGVEAVLHLSTFDPAPRSGPRSEQDGLEMASRGTYVLLQKAREAGVDRLILASTISLLEDYPENYVVDESWQPRPRPNAESLAPFLAEITCREFAREGGINTICLRFGDLDHLEGTSNSDALQALSGALNMTFEPSGYRWFVFHVTSNGRFPNRLGFQPLGFGEKEIRNG